ncbi:MAG TPA: hypothetical protein VMB47_15855 [Candidatus Aquilonibacter sp.]|nr:hypothetical protein [Candidatus Aquilonibacter sp.]
MANQWLALWLACCNWTIAAALIALAVAHSMRGPLEAALALIILGAVATAIAVWYTKPSEYRIAQELDRQSRLGDRISTAIHFWDASETNHVILRQRDDALAHLRRVNARELFPLQPPPKTWRTWVLVASLAAMCAFHSVYGPPITRLTQKALQSRSLAAIFSPLTRAMEIARAEKKQLADAVAGNDKDRQANETQKPFELPPGPQPTASAQANANAAKLNMSQAQQLADANSSAQNPATQGAQQGQPQGGTPSNSQSAASDQQGGQMASNGKESLGQRALQALENLMSSALSGQQNGQPSTQNAAQPPNAGTTSTQAMAGSSQLAASSNQAAQGQTSNSQGSQTQTNPTPGKHTGAGNGSSPWQPHLDSDPQLAGNMAKEHVELQTTGYRGPPGKERADVAPGTAQIPLQDLAPQKVTTVNGAGQDTVPPQYRQYVEDYFQHSGK